MHLKINHLQHVGLPVTNIEQSKAFYARLGFESAMDSTFLMDGATGLVCMMKRENMVMELYQVPEPALSQVKQRGDGHIDHIAFDVSDIDEAFELLKTNGFDVLEESPVFLNFWQKGCKYFNITGPDDERLEFCQIL